jgi:hypothetical protein
MEKQELLNLIKEKKLNLKRNNSEVVLRYVIGSELDVNETIGKNLTHHY